MSLFVYVIGSADEAGLLKIGRAVDVPRRLAQLKGMSPVPLSVLWSRETDNTDLESKLHRHFASYRRHGEWFDFQGSDWRSLINAAAEELESGAPLIRRPRGREQPALPPIWRAFQLTDGTPEWALDESEPSPSAAPRCPCGHKAARHSDNAPHACGGAIPWGRATTLCECTGFHGSSVWDPEWWQAQAVGDLDETSLAGLTAERASGRPLPPVAFRRGARPQDPSQDAKEILSCLPRLR
ncbi:GIY-YIG nuclease family protein [Streptacidiphilus carbonis]|uniref:GIY-YIG nuclease family protein n=1 Tax=Streptacidiphilus carbonis TaxID=105422 RepID=UPI000A02310C